MTIPVAAESKPRKIQIQGGRSEPQQISKSDQSVQEPSSGESEQ
jgi:hypothetical protein